MTKPTTERLEDTLARDCLAVRMRLLNRVVTNVYDEALRPLGVKVSQLNILVAAAKLGLARPADICRILRLDTSTLSRNVERMKAKGWLENVVEDDRRVQPFRLTAKGRGLLQRAKPAWDRAQQHVKQLIGDETAAAIESAVDRIHADQSSS